MRNHRNIGPALILLGLASAAYADTHAAVLIDVDTGLIDGAFMAGDVGDICDDPSAHRRFVHESLQQVENGADLEQVLDTLNCIAESGQPDAIVRMNAVRALFHLAASDADRQERLLHIIRQPALNSSVSYQAYGLLLYVLDADGRAALRQIIEAYWPSHDVIPAIRLLVELRDPTFQQWFDPIERSMAANEPLKGVLARFRKRLDLRKDHQTILAVIASDRTDVDRAWLVCEACRLGIEPGSIRQAVITFLGQSPPTTHGIGHASLIRACDEANISLPEDASPHNEIARVRTLMRSSAEGDRMLGPGWATMPDRKRDEFYGFTQTDTGTPNP